MNHPPRFVAYPARHFDRCQQRSGDCSERGEMEKAPLTKGNRSRSNLRSYAFQEKSGALEYNVSATRLSKPELIAKCSLLIAPCGITRLRHFDRCQQRIGNTRRFATTSMSGEIFQEGGENHSSGRCLRYFLHRA